MGGPCEQIVQTSIGLNEETLFLFKVLLKDIFKSLFMFRTL